MTSRISSGLLRPPSGRSSSLVLDKCNDYLSWFLLCQGNKNRCSCFLFCPEYGAGLSCFYPYELSMSPASLFDVYLSRFRNFFVEARTVPTFEHCMNIIGAQSKSVVHRFFQEMLRKGYLSKRGERYYPTNRLMSYPLFDSIRAGFPAEVADEAQADEVVIESYLVDHPRDTILLRVKGDSMIDAGIMEDDIVVVDKVVEPRIGSIVVGIIDGEYTMKFYRKDGQQTFFLEAANERKSYPPLYPRERLEIFGVVTGCIKKFA